MKRGLFGAARNIVAGDQSMGDLMPPITNQPLGIPTQQMPEQKPGFFGQGGIGRGIAGSIGDWLQQTNGLEATYGPAMAQRRQMEFLQQRAEQSRETDWQDYVHKQEYERANPKPSTAQPYRWESNDGDVYELGAQGPQRVFDDPTPKMNFIPDGMGGGQWASVPSAAANRPQIGAVVADPRKSGGPTAPQSGGFR